MNKGTLFVVTGPSGAGKGTVLGKVFQQVEKLHFSVSATTRAPREGEVDGVNYHFMTKEQFVSLVEQGRFLEYAQYVGNYYGTPMAPVEEKLEQGIDVLLEIEVQGAMQIREKFPEAVLIFVTPPTAAELLRRLRGRGTDPEEKIMKRLNRALVEVDLIPEYPYLVLNGEVDPCAESLHNIIELGTGDSVSAAAGGEIITDLAEKKAFAERFKKELTELLA